MNYIYYFLSKEYLETVFFNSQFMGKINRKIKGLAFEKSTDNYEGKEIKLGKTFHITRKKISQKKGRMYDFFKKKQAILQLHKLMLPQRNLEKISPGTIE